MNAEIDRWLAYARENLLSARLLAENGLYNPALQNAQQTVEKALKALLLAKTGTFPRTHGIGLLVELLEPHAKVPLEENAIDFLDSIYVPSKYPLAMVLPDFSPTREVAERACALADTVLTFVHAQLNPDSP